MTYCVRNFKTKKAVKEAIKDHGPQEVYEPGLGSIPDSGIVYLEGPHYPQPHCWYAEGTIENGRLVSVK